MNLMLHLAIASYWFLATSAVLVSLLDLPLPSAFKDAVRLSAARGKLWSTRPKSLGFFNDLSVPQAWFSHFYAIGTVCCVFLVLLATPPPSSALVRETGHALKVFPSNAEAIQYISLWLFLLHLLRRLLETCCLMVYPTSARMHTIAYLFGLSYYIVAPLSLLSTTTQQPTSSVSPDLLAPASRDPISETLGFVGGEKGLLEGEGDRLRGWVGSLSTRAFAAPFTLLGALGQALSVGPSQSERWLSSIFQAALGIGVTLSGFALQFHSHCALAALAARGTVRSTGGSGSARVRGGRKLINEERKSVGESELKSEGRKGGGGDVSVYSIPVGGAFEWVSCPHYAGEVVIYAGLTLLTWPNAANVPLMLGWVLTNLVLAARATQQWYRATFPGTYPKGRRALIPGVF